MKNLIKLCCTFSFFLLAVACDLEEIPDSFKGSTTACFTYEKLDEPCSANCQVQFTNCSESADSYEWDFGDGNTVSGVADPLHEYAEAGTYTVVLTATSGDLSNTFDATVIIQESTSSGFKVALSNLSSVNVIPYGAVERSEGDIHVLFYESTFKSALIDMEGKVLGDALDIPLDMAVNRTEMYEGGFLLSGEKSANAKVCYIAEDRSKEMERSFQFNNDASNSQGIIVNLEGEIVTTGLRQAPSPIYPGFAKIDISSGEVKANPIIDAFALREYGGVAIVQKPNKDYFVTANYLVPPGSENALLLSISSTGNFNSSKSLSPLTFANHIVKTTGDNYAVAGKDGGGIFYILGINSTGTVAWQRELSVDDLQDMIFTSDGELAICGTKSGELYYAKLPPVNGTTYTWEKQEPGANGNLKGVSITQSSDNGFIVLAEYDNNGKKEPYLLKADEEGNTD